MELHATPKETKAMIISCFKARRPCFIWGPPGIGKSELVAEIGKEQGRDVIDMRLLLMDPTDLKGIPYYCEKSDSMKWAPSSELRRLLVNSILFLDEMNCAPLSVQAAAYQLILNRRVGEFELPDDVSMVAAGNRDTDRGVTYRMPKPLSNRLIHISMIHSSDDWITWAMLNKINRDVVAFISQHPHRLFDFDPTTTDVAFATPRTWAFVSQALDDSLPESTLTKLIAGAVGQGNAIEFIAHRRSSANLPNVMDVLKGEVDTLDTDDISAKYSLSVSLCYKLNDLKDDAKFNEYVNNFFGYASKNFQAEMAILCARTLIRDMELNIDHTKLDAFSEFFNKYGKYVIGA